MPNFTILTLGELISHPNTTIRRLAKSILATLERLHAHTEDPNQDKLPL